MKPKYIFGAVFLICVLMVTVLPQIGGSSSAAAAPAAVSAPAVAGAEAGQSPAKANPIPANNPQKAAAQPTAQPTLEPFQAAAAQPAAKGQPAAPAGQELPSPADPAASPGQGLAAIPATSSLPGLEDFAASVRNGNGRHLAGVYVPGLFALRVVQQLNGDVNYVDTNDGTVTEYSRSAAYNVVGLLAHNTLSSGQSFFRLKPGQDVVLVYGDGHQQRYRVDHVENYQALSSADPYSDFVDLNGPGGERIPNDDLFRRIYTTAGQVVFQTCFEANGDPSWGRMFVIAKPV